MAETPLTPTPPPKRPKVGGRKKGTPNRATADVRATIASFASANVLLMSEKMDAIEDPVKWMEIYLRAIEYHIPKLGRTEVTGADGGPLVVEVVKYGGES